MNARHDTGPWLITAAVLTAGVCAVAWPVPTGWAAGLITGTTALLVGLRMLRAERQPKVDHPACAGCAGCGGPNCLHLPELTAEEALELAEEIGRELYQAEDALAFVGEMCGIADRQGRTITTANVRAWLRGPLCARQAGLALTPDAIRTDPDPIRTAPNDPGRPAPEQGGPDPDTTRTDPHDRLQRALDADPELRAEFDRIRLMLHASRDVRAQLADQLAAARAAGLREAAAMVDNDDTCGCGGCDTCIPRALAADIYARADAIHPERTNQP